MLIKINTSKHKVVYINPEYIVLAEQSPVDPDICLQMNEGAKIWITPQEFARILPMLNAESNASQASAAPFPYKVVTAWKAFEAAGISHEIYGDGSEGQVLANFEHTRAMFLTHFGDYMEALTDTPAAAVVPALPADLIAAYENWRWHSSDEKIFDKMIDTLASYLPKEKTE